ncbi:MAG: aminoacyl-tRNA hydrolase [Betaproteobacteria bacterium]|nr:MAG: aminoacyl-tRNA hydrolase [Betaproteobacteria bacterium]
MRLLVGLGNPGRRYEATRHNAGFWWVDSIADELGVGLSSEPRFQSEVGRYSRADFDCWLLKPATFMNESGRAVRVFCDFYKLSASDILVVHDELDLAPGVIKLKRGGGVAGHNGLRDIAAHMGKDFWRLRIGIGHPGVRDEVAKYVLAPPRKEEAALISEALERSLAVWPQLMRDDFEDAMLKLHTRA